MAATGPEGNRCQPSPPGAVFFVAMLIPGPVIVPRMTRLTAGCPACEPEVSGAAGHHRPAGRRAPRRERLARSDTTMTTTAAISPVIRNVLSVAKIPPMAVTASQMARITPRIVHIIRPMYPVCARRPAQGGAPC